MKSNAKIAKRVANFNRSAIARRIACAGIVAASCPAHALDLGSVPSNASSGALVEETISQSPDPRAYDWRRTPLQIEAGYGAIEESNTFKSRFYSLGLSTSVATDWIALGALRMVDTEATGASGDLAKTPYSQAGMPSHYEAFAGAGYLLLDGRSATPLSPGITDLGHALFAIGGIQYNYFTSRDAEPVPAMRAVYYDLCADLGLRFTVYLPRSLGLSFEWTVAVPIAGADPDLPGWQRFAGNLSWSFGK